MSTREDITSQRFALVMILSLATVLVTIATPPGDATRALALLLQGLALIVALVAARGHEHIRRRTGIVLALLLLTACVLTSFGVIDDDVRTAISLAIALATPAVMIRGLVRLLRERGVVAQALFGAIALYLQIGLLFAFAAAGIGLIQETPFFGGDDRATTSEFVYFSFTTMSTTGYGDLTPVTSPGRSLAVLEMLIGQIYLVTIVGLLVGNMGRSRRTAG